MPRFFDVALIQRTEIVQIHFQGGVAIDKTRVVKQPLRARQRVKLLECLQRTARAADVQALEREQALGDGPAFVDLADEVVFVRAHVVEKHLAEFFVPGDVADGTQGDARRFHVHQQEADAALLLHLFVGAHQHINVGGVVRHRGPDFAAVDDVFVAIEHGLGAQARKIGTRIGFGIALAPHVVAGKNFRQVLRALRVVAEANQRWPHHGDALIGHAADAGAFGFFPVNNQLARVQPHAAVLNRPVGCEPAFFRERDPPILALVPAQPARHKAQVFGIFFFEKLARLRAESFIGHCIEVGLYVTEYITEYITEAHGYTTPSRISVLA